MSLIGTLNGPWTRPGESEWASGQTADGGESGSWLKFPADINWTLLVADNLLMFFDWLIETNEKTDAAAVPLTSAITGKFQLNGIIKFIYERIEFTTSSCALWFVLWLGDWWAVVVVSVTVHVDDDDDGDNNNKSILCPMNYACSFVY